MPAHIIELRMSLNKQKATVSHCFIEIKSLCVSHAKQLLKFVYSPWRPLLITPVLPFMCIPCWPDCGSFHPLQPAWSAQMSEFNCGPVGAWKKIEKKSKGISGSTTRLMFTSQCCSSSYHLTLLTSATPSCDPEVAVLTRRWWYNRRYLMWPL